MRLVFDRGTLLLEGTREHPELDEIPCLLWDGRVSAYRAPACAHAELRDELVRRGVRFSDDVRPAGPEPEPFAPLDLRPYQEAALHAWRLAGGRGVVALPTGSGKTRLALAAVARSRGRALCLVPTRVLLDQWLRELRKVYAGALGRFGDGERELAPLTVATFESAYRHMARIGSYFDLLVVDEAHHYGCGARDESLEMATAHLRVGLTATPPRDPVQAARLAELVGPTVYELGIGDLAGRFLASFNRITLHLDLDGRERTDYERDAAVLRAALTQFRRLSPRAGWADFVRGAMRTPEGRRALGAWRRARRLLELTRAKRAALAGLLSHHRDARVLVFTAGNDSAYAIAREHLIMPLTCDIGRRERDEVLERFRRGELTALVSARVLNEGLDVPDADVAIILGGTLGEREHVQRIGRLLRPAPGKRALVYELVTRRTMEVRQWQRRQQGVGARRVAQL